VSIVTGKAPHPSKPTVEGVGVHLRRAPPAFGNTKDFYAFFQLDGFRNEVPEDYLARLPLASASRHRDDYARQPTPSPERITPHSQGAT